MLNKQITTPNFTIKQLINIVIIGVIIYFVFSNYNSSNYLVKQNKAIEKRNDSLIKENKLIKKQLVGLDFKIKQQDSISKLLDIKIKNLKYINKKIKRDYEASNNKLNALSEYKLDSAIRKMLQQ